MKIRLAGRTSPLALFLFFTIGLDAVLAQILFMREFIVLFRGNELSLGILLINWLFWTAAGSYIIGRIVEGLNLHRLFLSFLYGMMALIIPLSITIIRSITLWLPLSRGETADISSIFLISFITLSIFCFIAGGLFPAASRYLSATNNHRLYFSIGYVYVWETAGSALGGLLASFLLIPKFDALTISLILAGINTFIALHLLVHRSRTILIPLYGLAGIFLLGILSIGLQKLDHKLRTRMWQGYELQGVEQSRYGRLAVASINDHYTFFQNGSALFTVPDDRSAEEAVHYALLLHPKPRNVLIIGSGFVDPIHEANKHAAITRIDYVALDESILDLYSKYIRSLPKNRNIHFQYEDGRHFLQRTEQQYDVIIIHLPDPSTAQLNRFYTREFYQLVRLRLKPDGIYSFQVSSSENYINENQARYLQCIYKTLNSVFDGIQFLPGEQLHLFAGSNLKSGAVYADTLTRRLKKREIQTRFVREYFLPYRLSPDRVQTLRTVFNRLRDVPVNTDFKPAAYYFHLVLWSTQFSDNMRMFAQKLERLAFPYSASLILLLFITMYIIGRHITGKKSARHVQVVAAVAAMGFSLIGFEILIILGFQSVHGYVYYQLAVLIALFMAGMSISAGLQLYFSFKRPFLEVKHNIRLLIGVHLLAIFIMGFLILLFIWIPRLEPELLNEFLSPFMFGLLTLITGAVGGFQFPLANRIYIQSVTSNKVNAGLLYSMDLVGALLGSFLLSILFVPLFGLVNSAIFIGLLNLLVVLALLKRSGIQ